jgi:hypothetical protein
VLAAALLFFTLHLFSNNNLEFGHESAVSTQGYAPAMSKSRKDEERK